MGIFIHTIWSTKNRYPFLHSAELRTKVWEHIKENAIAKKIGIDSINGTADHCHCIIVLSAGQKLNRTMMLIKGESSYWINKNGLCKPKFEWQDYYYSKKIDQFDLERVREYIAYQEEHHKVISFKDEVEALQVELKSN